jgi:hypothetical protein
MAMDDYSSDEVEANEELGVRLVELRDLLHDMTIGGLLLGYEVSIVTSSVVGSLWWRAAHLGQDYFAAEAHRLSTAVAAVDRAVFDCPYGAEPSPVEWRYVPPPKDYMELRCLHAPPPGHCWKQHGPHYKRVTCT